EAREHLAEPRPLAQDRDPRQPRLEALETHLLEQRAVAVQRYAPLFVVITGILGVVADPRAARAAVGAKADIGAHRASLRSATDAATPRGYPATRRSLRGPGVAYLGMSGTFAPAVGGS